MRVALLLVRTGLEVEKKASGSSPDIKRMFKAQAMPDGSKIELAEGQWLEVWDSSSGRVARKRGKGPLVVNLEPEPEQPFTDTESLLADQKQTEETKRKRHWRK